MGALFLFTCCDTPYVPVYRYVDTIHMIYRTQCYFIMLMNDWLTGGDNTLYVHYYIHVVHFQLISKCEDISFVLKRSLWAFEVYYFRHMPELVFLRHWWDFFWFCGHALTADVTTNIRAKLYVAAVSCK